MHTTIFCTFKRNVGWRVHSVANIETNCISVVLKNGIKMLAIPVVGKVARGQFCNPAKLLMAVVRQLKCAIPLTKEEVVEPDAVVEYYMRSAVSLRKSERASVMLH